MGDVVSQNPSRYHQDHFEGFRAQVPTLKLTESLLEVMKHNLKYKMRMEKTDYSLTAVYVSLCVKYQNVDDNKILFSLFLSLFFFVFFFLIFDCEWLTSAEVSPA